MYASLSLQPIQLHVLLSSSPHGCLVGFFVAIELRSDSRPHTHNIIFVMADKLPLLREFASVLTLCILILVAAAKPWHTATSCAA